MYDCFNIYEETSNAICKFTVLWNYFESYVYGKECNPKNIFMGHEVVDNYDREKCKKLIKNVKTTVLDYAEGANVFDRLIPSNRYGEIGGNRKNIVISFFQINNETEDDANTFIAIEYVIYRIRCNLFHGLKSPYLLNDQIKLFNAINDYLDYMINYFAPCQNH